MFEARQKKGGALLREEDFTRVVKLKLSKLPCWEHLTDEQYRDQVRELFTDIEAETRAMHRMAKTRPLGVEKIKAQHPHSRPSRLDRSPAPMVHAATKEARRLFWEGLRGFVEAYRFAAERLREGDLTVAFPEGSFPPPRQFVPIPRARAPGTV